MTELDRLRQRTWSAPPTGVLEAVTTLGRARQRRLVTGTGVLAAAAVLLALQVVPGADSRQTLVPARTPQLTQVPVAPERQGPPPSEEMPDAEAGAEAPGTGGELGRTSGAGTDLAQYGPGRRPGAAQGAMAHSDAGRAPDTSQAKRGGSGGAYSRMAKYRGTEPSVPNCPVNNNRVSACGFDSDADVGPASAGRRDLGFHKCQDADRTSPLVLKYASEAELVLTVRDADARTVWTWQPARPYRNVPHQEQVAAGDCLFWTTSWREVDDDSRPLPGGVYELHVDFLGDTSRAVHSTTFTIAR